MHMMKYIFDFMGLVSTSQMVSYQRHHKINDFISFL